MERRMNKYTHAAGVSAFIWRLVLTTGTGSIFGFLVARQAYDAALMAPMFVVMSFSLPSHPTAALGSGLAGLLARGSKCPAGLPCYLLQVASREHSFDCSRFGLDFPGLEEESILECFQRRRKVLGS